MLSIVTPGSALIALDWGTSSLRAYRYDASGAVLESRHSTHGILHLPQPGAAGFTQALNELCADWLSGAPQAPLLACGMVGSAQGWHEVPYVESPLAPASLAAQLARHSLDDGRALRLVPGLIQRGALPNVMRGEETQVIGALAQSARQDLLIGLPGTHSKWVRVTAGRIVHFDTFMTGELYSLLSTQSILARTLQSGERFDRQAFELALAVARGEEGRAGLLSTLFSTRTLGLTGQLSAGAQADYLSGLLIGHEVAALCNLLGAAVDAMPVVLIGAAALCERYARALEARGFSHVEVAHHATERGLWQLAVAAGLVATPISHSQESSDV
jgi:2-dehydro-3-deoxygalactonokinase